MSYISLHNHSFASLRDGFSSPAEMAAEAVKYHQNAIAITDHGTVSMVPQFYQECISAGIKPILGNEMYICSDVLLKDRTYHLIVLAKNNEGYKNLLKLDTIAHENYYKRPRIDMNILREHKEGLVITSACMGSWWNTEQAEERTREFKELFGDDFYLELQANSWEDQKVYNGKIMELAKRHKVKIIITTDAHVPNRKMCKYQHMWNALGKPQAFYTTEDFYLMGEQEIIERMSSDIPMEILRSAIDNTQEIADKCNVTISVAGDNYPKYPCGNQDEKIKELCRIGWKHKISGKIPKELWETYVTQFNHEMDVLNKCNYYNILLITWDYINYAREHDIFVGPARGSCAGSLVCYLMGITDVDPIENHLVFERFVNEERITPGD